MRKRRWSSPQFQTRFPWGTEQFCKRILRDRSVRLNFLSLHIRFRKIAEAELAIARGKGKGGSARHLELARQYGSLACFAAIETDAAPLRVDNALNLTFRGQGAWLVLPSARKKDASIHIPANCTKNGMAIDAPMLAESKTRGLQTVLWYLKVIRPFFDHADTSDYVFPAVTKPGQPLSYGTFTGWWYPAISAQDLPEMTPHKFRHGQATIIAMKNPGNWTLVAARLGDTEETVMKFYAFVDKQRLMSVGQRHLTEEFE